jgi:SNF2 family DNA or RNA helicase
VDFTVEERDFYSKLEAESRTQFREYAEAGTVKQNYVNILLMLLRLRQACDHPLLVNGEYSFTWESSVGLAKKQIQSDASLAICGICNVRFFCLVNYYTTCFFFSLMNVRGQF